MIQSWEDTTKLPSGFDVAKCAECFLVMKGKIVPLTRFKDESGAYLFFTSGSCKYAPAPGFIPL